MQSTQHALTKEQKLDVIDMAGYSVQVIAIPEMLVKRLILRKHKMEFYKDFGGMDVSESDMPHHAFDFFLEIQNATN